MSQPSELSKLKRLRSAKQTELSRTSEIFQNTKAELNKAGLRNFLNIIDELQKKFQETEDQIICLNPDFDELDPEAKLPMSTAASKFSDDYTNLRKQILELLNYINMQERSAVKNEQKSLLNGFRRVLSKIENIFSIADRNEEHMNQPEEVKKIVQKPNTTDKICKRIHIKKGSSGFGYRRIFEEYMKEDVVKEITVEDPYFNYNHQVKYK